MKTATIITVTLLALASPSFAGTAQQDYGVLTIPADAPAAALTVWQTCSGVDREAARSSLRFGCGDRVVCQNYVSAPGHGEDRQRLKCFAALIEVLGGTVLEHEGHYAHDRMTYEERPAASGRWIEVEGPLGYYVTWAQRTDGCEVSIWGVLGPPKEGTPWYLAGAPSMRLPCEGQ